MRSQSLILVMSFLLISISSISTVPVAGEPYRQPAGIADMESLYIAAGYNALFTCSAHFMAHRPLHDIKKVELADTDSLHLPDPVIDQSRQFVTVRYSDVTVRDSDVIVPHGDVTLSNNDHGIRIAAFRKGMGCTLLPPHWGITDIPRLPYVHYQETPDVSEINWPMGDKYTVEQPEKLADVIDRAFDHEYYGAGTLTTGVIIVRNGEVIAEKYRHDFGPDSGYRTWSTAKSISASLIGIAVKKGLLDIDDAAPIPEWQHPADPRRHILLKQLMWMSSGLYGGGNNTAAVYFGGQDVISAVTTTPLEATPGLRWKYANNDTLLTLRALKFKLNNDLDYLRFPYHELLHKIGMYHTVMETDHLGNFIGSSQVYTTTRDLARFGLLLVNDGVWMKERILPEGWLDFVSTPAPARPIVAGKQGYGAQFWLLGTMPGLPADTFTSAGNKGQLVTVVPSQNLVVVRTGVDPRGHRWNQPAFVAEILKRL